MTQNQTVDEKIQRHCQFYEQGRITLNDAIYSVSMYSVEPVFFECLECLPTEIVDGLKESASNPPLHPEDIFIMAAEMAYYALDCDIDQAKREWRQKIYWTQRYISEHYFPDLPMPEFEPILFVGHVSRQTSFENQKCIVIGGETAHRSYIAYDHPILLATPCGVQHETQCTGRAYQAMTPEEEEAKYGTMILEELDSSIEIPVGTAIRIDRSMHVEIPPLSE